MTALKRRTARTLAHFTNSSATAASARLQLPVPTSSSEKAAGEGAGDLREQAALLTAEEPNLGADAKPRNTAVFQEELLNRQAGAVRRVVAVVIVADSGRGGPTDNGVVGALST
jgi:N-acetylmuramoyl-L-alanine amidase